MNGEWGTPGNGELETAERGTWKGERGSRNGEEEEGVTGNVFPEKARRQRICLQPIPSRACRKRRLWY